MTEFLGQGFERDKSFVQEKMTNRQLARRGAEYQQGKIRNENDVERLGFGEVYVTAFDYAFSSEAVHAEDLHCPFNAKQEKHRYDSWMLGLNAGIRQRAYQRPPTYWESIKLCFAELKRRWLWAAGG